MSSLIIAAYGLQPRQLSGPSWLLPQPSGTEYYDLNAELPAGATDRDMPAMLRTLLAQRFRLSAHWEAKKTPVYALEIEPGGLKLKPHQPSPDDDQALPGRLPGRAGADPQAPPVKRPSLRIFINFVTGRSHLEGFTTMAGLADQLHGTLGRPVVDRTGVQGAFDLAVEAMMPDLSESTPREEPHGDWVLPGGRHVPGDAPPFFDAMKKVGLRFVPSSAELDYLIVDRCDKIPTAN